MYHISIVLRMRALRSRGQARGTKEVRLKKLPFTFVHGETRGARKAPMSVTIAPTVLIRPRKGLFDLDLRAIWPYRELLYFFVWRDVKVRYKQTLIGAGWAILQPVISIAIFTFVFSYLMKMPSDGVPYPVFAYTALLPWSYFAKALDRSGGQSGDEWQPSQQSVFSSVDHADIGAGSTVPGGGRERLSVREGGRAENGRSVNRPFIPSMLSEPCRA